MGLFAKLANNSGWQDKLQQQQERMSKIIKPSKQEAIEKARASLAQINQQAFEMGYKHRLGQQSGVKSLDMLQGLSFVPGREVVTALRPNMEMKTAGIADYIRNQFEEMRLGLEKDKARLMKTTEDPKTLPWYLPAMTYTVPRSFTGGYEAANKQINADKMKQIEADLASAKADFEQAMKSEMTAGSGKMASAGQFIDGLAKGLLKQGFLDTGDLNRALGYYLSGASVLGQLASEGGYKWMEARDPRKLKAEALERAIRDRMRLQPSPIFVTPRGNVDTEGNELAQAPTDDQIIADKSPGEVEG